MLFRSVLVRQAGAVGQRTPLHVLPLAGDDEVQADVQSRIFFQHLDAKTSYLINNDAASASSKNKKARELGVSVITEEELMALMGKAE